MNFLIYTLGRTGSTLLSNLANNIPAVFCEGEILDSRPVDPFRIIADKAEACECLAFGFKVKTSHLHNPRLFLEEMQDKGFKLIYLERENHLDICISYIYARECKNFFYYKGRLDLLRSARPKINLDYEEVISMLVQSKQSIDFDKNLFADLDYLKIVYELDLKCNSNHRNTIHKLSDYLGLSRFNGRINPITVKSIPSFSRVISNWSFIYDKLKHSPYSRYLSID